MESKAELLQWLNRYDELFSTEHSTGQVRQFLATNEEDQLFTRTNFNGHFTASAFIVNKANDALLLLHHKKLKRWLQPGGHIDEGDISLLSAALREATEETGLAIDDLEYLPLTDTCFFDVDSHLIPVNINKGEPAHYHHDLRFVFRCAHAKLLNLNMAESTGFKWVLINELQFDETFATVARKLTDALQ